ncbi:MAG: MarR family winged helix-turn-helix transcriptional regulator [Luteimonas sp.]|nr:MarR family winged helix-turn-helix transcriptional regulator [Luteimonas sp.]
MSNRTIAAPDPSSAPASPCTCFRLRKLSRLLSQRYDAALAPAGINVNQFSILRRAARTPQAIGALALELGMDRTTLTRDLKHLVDAGWIRFATGEDARRKQVVVTAAGNRTVEQARPLWQAVQDETGMIVGDTALEKLHAVLDRATRRLEAR